MCDGSLLRLLFTIRPDAASTKSVLFSPATPGARPTATLSVTPSPAQVATPSADAFLRASRDVVALGSTSAASGECPKLTEARVTALLRGTVPCFIPSLGNAYGDGVRAVAPESAGTTSLEDLRPAEVAALLSQPAPLSLLAVHVLLSLTQRAASDPGAREVLDETLSAGALVALFQRVSVVAVAFEARLEELDAPSKGVAVGVSGVSAMSELSVMAELIANLCARSESLFPADKPHRLTSPGQVSSLASACTAAMRRAAIAQFKGTPQASTELDVATRLLYAFQVMGS